MKVHGLGIAVVVASGLAGGILPSAACTSFSSDVQDDSGTESGLTPLYADLRADSALEDASDAHQPGEDAADGGGGPMYVFVSSETRLGNMGGGGRAAADTLCQNLGNTFKVGRKWIAWLSLDGPGKDASARARLPTITPEYRLVNDTRVLVAGAAFSGATGLEHAIDRDETSMLVDNAVPVWTGTAAEGTFQTAQLNCANWTASTGSGGGVGAPTFRNFNWTEKTSQPCGLQGRVYCFEIPAQ
ncbi:MAG TPA: hypothetical protein VLT33_24725 [Labilithrix sp.]|nr:hypothetical protein [Labilithrix sp.]